MFKKVTLQDLPAYQALSDAGRAYVADAFDHPPARAVGQTALRNVAGAYASPKFRYLTDYESAGCEKVYILNAIADRDVVEVLSQPPPITVVTLDKRGRRRRRGYVPDYLEVRQDGLALIEAKTRNDLKKLAATYDDWHIEPDGCWTFSPAVEECTRLGLGFRIFSPDDLPQALRTNLQILSRLPTENLLLDDPGTLRRVQRLLDQRPYTLSELSAISTRVTGAFIYQALMREEIWGDLRRQHFDLDFILYRSEAAALRARTAARVNAPGEFGPLHQRLMTCSASELEAARVAQKRYDDRRSKGLKLNATDYRDQRKQRQAEQERAPRLAAFVRRLGDRGSRKKLLPKHIHHAMHDHAESYLKGGGLPFISRMYAHFAEHSDLPKSHIPSQETYRKSVHEHLGPERAAFLSGGRRAFHAAKARTDGAQINAQLAIAGLRIHLDGVYGDVRSALDEGQVFQRPIFYPMIDDVTGYVLGRGVKLGRSSSFASLMAIRDCYLRHGSLPAQVHTDRGSEFKNNAFQDACAYFGIGFELRPAGCPRSGGMSEMLNQQLSAFLQNLAGGMYFDKAGRSADGSKKSRRTASLTVENIISKVDEWLFEIWNKNPFGSNTKSPEQAWLDSLGVFPEALVPAEDTEMARYQTSYPLKGLTFDPVRGYRYGGQGFSSDQLSLVLRRSERPANPRLDCTNPSVIRVLTKQGPLALRSTQYQSCQGLDAAQLLGRMKHLFASRSRGAFNQHQRLRKEVHLLADVAKSSAANPNDVARFEARKSPQEQATGRVDFSDVMDGLSEGLARMDVLPDSEGIGDDRA